ncbi:MAG TPA: hypothetical protein HA326_04860 [Thermoplasmata archaeon]|nr:hypothetical protein [Thermoplasmata archaeon]
MPEGGGPLGLDAETLLMAGGFVLVFALVVVFMTFSFTPMLVYICVPGGVLPAAIALLFGAIEWHREKQLKEFAALLGRYRRVRMDDLAAKSGKTSVETERLLTRALQLKYVDGVVDRATGEFVLAGAEKEQVFVERCPHCGGIVNRWAFPEERFPCPYCDVAVDVPSAASNASMGAH